MGFLSSVVADGRPRSSHAAVAPALMSAAAAAPAESTTAAISAPNVVSGPIVDAGLSGDSPSSISTQRIPTLSPESASQPVEISGKAASRDPLTSTTASLGAEAPATSARVELGAAASPELESFDSIPTRSPETSSRRSKAPSSPVVEASQASRGQSSVETRIEPAIDAVPSKSSRVEALQVDAIDRRVPTQGSRFPDARSDATLRAAISEAVEAKADPLGRRSRPKLAAAQVEARIPQQEPEKGTVLFSSPEKGTVFVSTPEAGLADARQTRSSDSPQAAKDSAAAPRSAPQLTASVEAKAIPAAVLQPPIRPSLPQPVAADSGRAASRRQGPQVQIGQVDIVIQAAPRPRTRESAPTADAAAWASRNYLRSI